ncbi:MAG: hypothetical protein IPG94_00055 [Kineosporiaceae bacterium]|nr:hypothetical protein [Kineosporiaceae bacterium]
MSDPDLARVLAAQHGDGSWGAQATLTGRIITTIFTARSLQEAGVAAPGGAAQAALDRALDVLAATAIVEGAASITGAGDGVLSCYSGMLARLMVNAGRAEQAQPLLDWIVRYQPVVFGGIGYHQPPEPMWGEYLRHRYGGCMASTTCLLGLVPTLSALVIAERAGLPVAAQPQLTAMRRLLTDRRVLFARSGTVLPLAGRTKADPTGTRWLAPAFPRDYVIDLIELVQLAVDLDVPADALTEAVELIASWRLPDGGWPMSGTRRLPLAYRPEKVDRRRSSPIITARVAALGLLPASPQREGGVG